MISDGAEDPGFDYKLRYRALGSPTFGDAGTKRGAKESVTLWKKRKQKELSQLGWEVVAWLGEKEAYKSVIGTILAPGANQKREVSENKVQMFSKEWWLESLKTEDEDLLIEGMTLEEGVKFDNFLKDLANRGKQPLEKIRKSMMNKNTLSVAKLNNFSVDKLFQNGKKGFQAYQKIINYVPDKLAKNLAKTKLGQKKEKGLKKLDNFLQEHPKLKRVMGMGAAAAVTYAWTKMTFIGDPEYDLDLSSAATAAATGDVSFSDLFAGEMGTKFLVLTAVGATTGLTAPYVKAFGSVGTMAAGLSFGAFRAYKKRKESKVDKQKTKTKSPDVVKNPNPRGRKKMISTQSAVRWVAKNKGNKAALKYAKSLSEVSKTGTPKGSEEIGGYKGFVDEKDYESYKKWISKSLRVQLLEGGAAGHMNHPFDDADLTFGDLKKIIKLGLSGKLNREDNVTEKLDGQNLLISWKGNQLVAARNKGQLKGFGENALNINAVKSLFI